MVAILDPPLATAVSVSAPPLPLPSAVTLRPYQEAAIAAVDAARAEGRHAALVVLPTGCGKTVCFGELVRRWDVSTLIIAHRQELLQQAEEKIRSLWPAADIGLIGAGRNEPGHRVTIGSVQSLTRPKRLAALALAGVRLVVVDEAHHTAAPSYSRLLHALGAGEPGGAFLLGVTATPDRADGKSITDEIYGEPVFAAGLPEMIAAEWLCDLRGLQVRTGVRLDAVHVRAGDYATDELAAAVNRPDRNRVIVAAFQKHAADRQTLVFAVDVQHAHDLVETFRAAGVAAAALDGTTPREERRQILADYAAARLQVITNCAVLTEGFDAPQTGCIILARPTGSRPLYVQMVGRGTRPAPGKRDCLIIDVADVSTRHSLTAQSLPRLVGRSGYAGNTSARAAAADSDDERDTRDNSFSLREAVTVAAPHGGGELIERRISLLDRLTWEPVGDGNYRLRLGGGRATLWLVLKADGYVAGVVWPDGHQQQLTAAPVALDWAQQIAERAALQVQAHQSHLVDRRATWRNAPASEKQIATLRRLRVRVPRGGLTKGEASDLIEAALARQSA